MKQFVVLKKWNSLKSFDVVAWFDTIADANKFAELYAQSEKNCTFYVFESINVPV